MPASKDLLDGKADYLIAGYYPGLAEAAKEGLKDKIVALNQALLSQEMFVAFSKKSPCRSLAGKFGQAITGTDDRRQLRQDAGPGGEGLGNRPAGEEVRPGSILEAEGWIGYNSVG